MRTESKSKNKAIEIISKNLSELDKRRKLLIGETAACVELMMKELKEKHASDVTDETNALLHEDYEVFTEGRTAVISYVKNNYNDAAFLAFSKLFNTPKVSYGASFEEVCERVYNGVCDYCILPLESVAGGKLFSFYSLVEKYDLHIFAACDIDETSSSKRTRYALLSRTALIWEDNSKKSYFEFSIIKDDSYALTDVLDVAFAMGAKLYRIDSIPLPYDDLTFRIYHVFEADANTLLNLRLYLENKYPQLKTVGHYLLIELN